MASPESLPENSSEATPRAEHALLNSIRGGDDQALANLYDEHSRLVYSVALRILRDASRAEDVLQEVFLKVWRKPASFVETRGTLAPLLAITARNCAIDIIRRQRTDESCDEMELAGSDNVMNAVETSLLIQKVKQTIHLLPAEQRKALDMAFFRGMTHAEIVSVTGLPLGTVKTRIRSALLFLGKSLRGSRVAAAQSIGT